MFCSWSFLVLGSGLFLPSTTRATYPACPATKASMTTATRTTAGASGAARPATCPTTRATKAVDHQDSRLTSKKYPSHLVHLLGRGKAVLCCNMDVPEESFQQALSEDRCRPGSMATAATGR